MEVKQKGPELVRKQDTRDTVAGSVVPQRKSCMLTWTIELKGEMFVKAMWSFPIISNGRHLKAIYTA